MVSIALPIAPSVCRPFGEAAESDLAGRQLVDHGKDMLGVAPKPVELPDGEHVAFAEMVQAGIELRPSWPSSRSRHGR